MKKYELQPETFCHVTRMPKGYYCTKKRINKYIDILLKSMTKEQLKSMLENAIKTLSEYQSENKNQIRFFSKTLEIINK